MENKGRNKAGIITFHFVNNFGGALQAYALQEAVKKHCNMATEIIDYRNGFIQFTDFVRLFPVTKNIREIITGVKTMRDRFGRLSRFKRFQSETMHLTAKHYSHYQLKSDPPKEDCYICGSDQIWNPYLTLGVKGAYFLDFPKSDTIKVAYAPSFGSGYLAHRHRAKVRNYLNNIGSISVRERTGLDIVRELVDKDAVQLIDPTFLLSQDKWGDLAKDPEINQPYMLLYIMQSDRKMYDYAQKLKEKTGLYIVEISRYGYNPGFVDQTLVDVGPEEFLGLFKNASYICTNSYHGFIFSLIFEKNLCLIPCKKFRTRIYNLADMLSIDLDDQELNVVGDTKYDREKVRVIIESEKNKAISWLNTQLRINE